MKIKRKTILLTLVFIITLGLIYIIVSSFSFNSLKFKTFFEHESHQSGLQIRYVLDNGNITYINKDNNQFIIEQIAHTNKEPNYILSFNQETINFDFFKKGKYYYFVYDNNKYLKRIDLDTKQIMNYTNQDQNKIIINQYDDSLYYYSDGLYNLETDMLCDISFDFIQNVKNIDFIDKDNLFVQDYDGNIYIVDIVNNKSNLINDKCFDYYINQNNLYYIYKENNKLWVNTYSKNNRDSFSIGIVDYHSIQVVDDYLYLISENKIQKVSISRKKKHELLQMSNYQNMTYNLSNVLIVNEKLMYLPMIKKEDVVSSLVYSYCLYRYKV